MNHQESMKIVIIEDEIFASRRLENMLHEYDPALEVVAKLESVKESVEWLKLNPVPDLIFLDIHLEDNISFAIFQEVSVACPLVFTTATDPSSAQAFAEKNIDFLLKPIIRKDLEKRIEKYRKLPLSERKVVDATMFHDILKKAK